MGTSSGFGAWHAASSLATSEGVGPRPNPGEGQNPRLLAGKGAAALAYGGQGCGSPHPNLGEGMIALARRGRGHGSPCLWRARALRPSPRSEQGRGGPHLDLSEGAMPSLVAGEGVVPSSSISLSLYLSLFISRASSWLRVTSEGIGPSLKSRRRPPRPRPPQARAAAPSPVANEGAEALVDQRVRVSALAWIWARPTPSLVANEGATALTSGRRGRGGPCPY